LDQRATDTNFQGDILDLLMERYLRPLKSSNARLIFKIFLEQKSFRSLTTLDIEAKFLESGVKLTKKEINWWLVNLEGAELITRDDKRGKPTIIDYDGKYTFDLWRMTDLGESIGSGLSRIFRGFIITPEDNVEDILKKISNVSSDDRKTVLGRLGEIHVIFLALRIILENGGTISKQELMDKIALPYVNIYDTLSKYCGQDHCSLFIQKQIKQGLREKILSAVGLSSRNAEYVLTSEGERLARLIIAHPDT
jgi:hypothetical protein